MKRDSTRQGVKSPFSTLPGCLLALVAVAAPAAAAEQLAEARLADPKYRYFDWSATLQSAAVVDLFWVGVSGSDEVNLGGGYLFRPSPAWRVAPLGYAVFANSAHQRGVKLAVLASFEKGEWKGSAFLGHFIRAKGEVGNYTVLDTLDLTRSLGEHVELGVSAGFFHLEGDWNLLLGPLAKWNDRHGAWALAYRFGDEDELRAGRVFLFP